MARDFLESGAAVDHFLADQLLLYMAIAEGGSYTADDLSTHLTTNIETIKKFLPVSFAIERKEHLYQVSCVGAQQQ
jgi:RNA 3'-terminal phosphate cyclase (ATP)